MQPTPPYLLAEDLAVLLLDPASGKERPSMSEQLLGGALVVDLALLRLVRFEKRRPRIVVVGAPPADPLLATAHHATTSGRRATIPQQVGRWAGAGARVAVPERLAARGVLRRDDGRTLGIRWTRWPADDTARRDAIGRGVVSMLLEGAHADRRSVALAAILVRTSLARVVLPVPRRTTHSDLVRGLRGHLLGTTPDDVALMDAAVSACGERSSGAAGDGGASGGGGGGDD